MDVDFSFFLLNTGKEGLKDHQEQIKSEIARARVALSGPLRRKFINIPSLPPYLSIQSLVFLFDKTTFSTLIFGVISKHNLL